MRARALEPNGLKNVRHRITGHRCGRQRKIDDPERDSQPARSFAANQLTGPREFERKLLDYLRKVLKWKIAISMLDRVIDNAGAGDADIQYRFRLADAVKRPGHEWIVFDGVGETNKLGAGNPEAILRAFGGLLNQMAHARDCIHVDSGASRRGVHRSAKPFGRGERFRNRIEKLAFVARKSFVHQRRITTDKIYADTSSRVVNCPAKIDGITARSFGQN